jgi:hypothetical protein
MSAFSAAFEAPSQLMGHFKKPLKQKSLAMENKYYCVYKVTGENILK